MALKTIAGGELEGKGVLGLADVPGLSAGEMQHKFEEVVRDVVIPVVNHNAENGYDKQETQDLVAQAMFDASAGDKVAALYDPRKIKADAFAAGNMTLAGYEKAQSVAPVAAQDDVQSAVGKLEAAATAAQDAANAAQRGVADLREEMWAQLQGMLFLDDTQRQVGWHKTGVDADGENLYKPMYEKQVRISPAANAKTTYSFSTYGLQDLEYVMFAHGYLDFRSTMRTISLPRAANNLPDNVTVDLVHEDTFVVSCNANWGGSGYDFVLYFRYIKTTDEARTKAEIVQ